MAFINTSFSKVTGLKVEPVQFHKLPADDDGPGYVFATQMLRVTTWDGSNISLLLHIENGCQSLAAGEVVTFCARPAGAAA
ncbi:hypothetical protein LBW62_06990 [Ralstonia solanacearum]|uniref:hypothetical protein n=1 Tax=Ralstonia solanacearum TaxID=305 RepID=UPI0005C75DCF|nr:hypothetical protein [Ralstonia solanacearum]MBB6590996.1 hypothetical protein [Ralstonia solanacearum]MBB6595191.1 hypothetical protein [Ralstonia solanacearum]MDB0541055.1 hypothetical protein [Ralstonia solanacearum]MDB0554142.1 hypothetical protein [Ralstonia solanacearum]MDB0555939.1 hypothetical protein [Ralstonia solanacearum]